MNTQTNVRQWVRCATCNSEINRVIWNYGKDRPITIFFCDNTCKGAWQRKQREDLGYTREWLIDQYITQNKSANVIAKEIGRDSKRVWEWITDYGLPTRPRGHNTDHLPKDGSIWKGRNHSPESRKRMSETAIAEGRVPYDPKVGPPMRGKRGKDTVNWKGGITPLRQSVYASPEWADAVKAVWKRADAKCERCGIHHNTTESRGTFHVHHIVGFAAAELRTEPSNLALLCKNCHYFVHSKKNIEKEFIKEIS